jgi:hypothetical protein
MVQTAFSVGDEADLTTALGNISLPSGVDAAPNTAYTITLTASIALTADALLDLDTGSSLTLEGDALFASGFLFTVTGAVTTDLNFTGTITLDGGSVDNVAIAENGGGTVIAGNYSGQIVGTMGDGGDSVVNAGSITFTGTAGAIEFDTGTSSVENTGTIIDANALGLGVVLGAGTVDNGTTSDTTGLISGGDYGVQINGAGVVNNDATITGTGLGATAVNIGSGTVNNGTTTDTAALIDGGANGVNGVWVETDTGIVNNFGTISDAGGVAVYLEFGGTVTNGSTADTTALLTAANEGVLVGSAAAGTIDNYGTITADDDSVNAAVAIYLEDGGTIENLGSLSEIDGLDWGVFVYAGTAFVQNAGSILGTGALGFGVDLGAGGTVVNGLASGSTATIEGTEDGVRIAAGLAGSGALVQNEGTIIGDVGVDFLSGAVEAAGTVVNDGLIESTASVSPYSIEFGDGDERLVLDAGGSFVGAVLGNDGVGATTTLELASGTSGTLSDLDDGAGTVTDSAGSFNFSAFGSLVFDAGSTWTISNPGVFPQADVFGNLDIANGVNFGGVMIEAGGTVTLEGTATSASEFTFSVAGASTLALEAPTSSTPDAVQALLLSFGHGGTIDLLNIANSAVTGFNYQSNTLYVLGNDSTLAVLDVFGLPSYEVFTHTENAATTGTYIEANPCFATDTAIRTVRGDVLVQDLRVGDSVVCVGGGVRPVVWIGRRTVDVARHPSPESVAPVRVRRGAFADGLPRRDLLLSPDHAVYADGVLIPVKHLINGSSIAQIAVDEVAYFHVELDRHDVLLAEDLPVESFLDTGNRAAFANHDGPVMLHPHFEHTGDGLSLMWEAFGYARLMVDGDEVRRVRERLALRMDQYDTVTAPDLFLAAGASLLRPLTGGDGCMRFHLPRGSAEVVIHSRDAAAGTAGRAVSVPIGAARFLGGDGSAHDVALDRLADAGGWYPLERRAGGREIRWTNGAARLAVPDGAFWLELHVADGPALPRAVA